MNDLIDKTLENYIARYNRHPSYIVLNERDANSLIGVGTGIRIKELVSFSYKGIPVLRTPDLQIGKIIVT